MTVPKRRLACNCPTCATRCFRTFRGVFYCAVCVRWFDPKPLSLPVTRVKRGRGRPLQFGERTQRYQVTIPARVAQQLRRLGAGSLSRGVRAAARKALRKD